MQIQENVELAKYSTMGLGGKARYLTEISSRGELIDACEFAKSKELPCLAVGSGSNITWRDEGYPGLIIISDIKGIEFEWQTEDEALVTIGSGEIWDNAVEACVSEGLSGIEALSLIPGKVGATPVQNVGAYGQEIADTLVQLEAYDMKSDAIVTISNQDCGFGYRTSRFKTTDRGRFFIITITLKLKKVNPQPPFYSALENYFKERNITDFTPQAIRDAVIDIRSHKLPNPKDVHNNGSFFANPIISVTKFQQLQQDYPDLPHWTLENDMVKIPAAWLIEKSGYKDYHDEHTGMATWANQPLVLVNEHAKTTKDLMEFRDKIVKEVKDKFDIDLVQEPEILPVK
ncbi:MAG TPA: UDP-N-acetylmuramate dehydrogenase [Candidatus Saccharimonadales bacterium]|nr:UDP-N-acetylmuramate dehydrogenase [Candidatus Saccharimonadales bacterium]